ncbi:hypoxanthine-guanine phosphoribosyltransferase [Sporolactobacillus inulinus]|uniref:Hypoxanthine-guanine phosphoribosyltransferase n=1 Tax=Sporolactobacillus inulinus TaxID=2078 RepID=A0A4Y1ZF96_9BACL|nr:hypoxanthine-guanine phosphoribosyltransferase [Sporolactobacillus inulinus]
MKDDVKEILITEREIQEKVSEFGVMLSEEYGQSFPLVIGVLKGALPFMADLIKKSPFRLKLILWMYPVMAILPYHQVK